MTRYRIVMSNDSEILSEAVNSWINLGWEVTGGLAMNGKYICQAMVKVNNEE